MKPLVCAIYTRKSSEEGLEQNFNSLDAQREACEAFILSQKAQGWKASPTLYDDGGFSGGTLERPALQRLMEDITAGRVQIVVVYKVDRLTRSLADFAKLVELFDARGVSFVSVTQQFNTTSSMGRLTLNVLLSFAQFEREVTGERIRDKIAASKRKGLWMGGLAPMGYVGQGRTLAVDPPQAERIREIFELYLKLNCVRRLKEELDRREWITPMRNTQRPGALGGKPFSRGHLYRILSNPVYVGQTLHKGQLFPGQHPAIVDQALWQAVQDRLAQNRQGQRTRPNAEDASLLAGLVFDEHGNRLTPSHAKKGARRYRYYVSRSLVTEGREAPGLRIPARDLEDAVVQAMQRFLTDKTRLIDCMDVVEAGQVRQRLLEAQRLGETPTRSSWIAVLQRLVRRVIVQMDRLQVEVQPGAIWQDDNAKIETIEMPVQLKRCGMAVRLIVRAPGASSAREPDRKLVALLAKANDWFSRLSSGRSSGVLAIADEQGVTSTYVIRVLYLAFLAPDLVQRIAKGDHPPELNADRLTRMVPLPMRWEEQRKLLGMGSSAA